MTRRTEKIARNLQVQLGELINYRLADPRVDRMVNVTRVDVTPDLRHAFVYVTVSDANETQLRTVMRGLENAAGKLAGMLRERVSMRSMPRLEIRLDLQAMRTRQTLDAIRKAMEQTPPADDETTSEENREG